MDIRDCSDDIPIIVCDAGTVASIVLDDLLMNLADMAAICLRDDIEAQRARRMTLTVLRSAAQNVAILKEISG